MENFLIGVRELAYDEINKTGLPLRVHVDLSVETGKRLAKELGVNVDIVEAGTLLMDYALGQAMKENRQNEHVKMSIEKAKKLLDMSSLSEEEKENISYCILEHHGVPSFFSKESEVCCNADCYRFTSIKGVGLGLRYFRDMQFKDLISLLTEKADEKWNTISLDIVKKELEPQHKIIMEMLNGLSVEK
jgi:exopolyphosphatase/pppGpp-phosphohydrolase